MKNWLPINYIKRFFRRNRLERALKKQPYKYTYNGIDIIVCKDVFPPNIGFASEALFNEILKYSGDYAADVGTGTGILALAMKQAGFKKVYAIDNHKPSIACAIQNIENSHHTDIEVRESDLLTTFKTNQKFDLIVFNHPYSPATNKIIFGNGRDGGKRIVERFLQQARGNLSKDGVILMSFSSLFREENNPEPIAKNLGYSSKVLFKQNVKLGTNYVFEFRI